MLMDGLLHRAQLAPFAIAVRERQRALNYAQLTGRARAFAQVLRSRGLEPGDRVAVVGPKSVEMLVALIGTSLVGGAFVPCDPRTPPERLARVLRDCDPKALVS